MNATLIDVHIDQGMLVVELSMLAIALALLVTIAYFLVIKKNLLPTQSVELNIKLGGIGSIKLKPNHEVKQIAHKAWVELKTRKAGLPIDKNNDVISDVYRSWYVLFGEIRNLARDVPAHRLKDKDTKLLVDVLVDSLNNGLRPHLTVWRAKYERWYEKAVAASDHDDLTPQDIQRKYKQYNDLVEDMLKINKLLVQYTNELKKIVDA